MTKLRCLSVPYPGVSRVLQEVEKTGLGTFEQLSWHDPMPDMQRIENSLKDQVLLLGGYAEPYEYFFNNVVSRVGILWTSPMLQTELTPTELIYLSRLKAHLDAGRLHFIWFGSRDWIKALNWDNTFYAPYPASVPKPEEGVQTVKHSAQFPGHHVGFYGPMDPRKNVLNQFLAAKELNATLHMSDLKSEYETLARQLRLDVVTHKWGEWKPYIHRLRALDAGLQVSLKDSESFSYVCFDHLSMGIPCLTSVEWAPPDIKVKDPLDVSEIVYKLRNILQNPPLPEATVAFAEHVAGTQTDAFKKAIGSVLT